MNLDQHLNLAKETALKAGAYLKTHFHQSHLVSSKSHQNDLVTECDKHSEMLIKESIKKQFSHSSFLCEESGKEMHNSSLLWVIDPLDGTVNFAKKIPFFCVSLGLLVDNVLSMGVIYSPMTDELFTATKSKGAFLNGKKISVTSQKDLKSSFGATGFPYLVEKNVSMSIKPLEKLLSYGAPVRRLGSAALDLAYTACGRFDMFFEAYLEAWDYAAGSLIVKEAGGVVTDYQNQDLTFKTSSSVCAANASLHKDMINKVLTL